MKSIEPFLHTTVNIFPTSTLQSPKHISAHYNENILNNHCSITRTHISAHYNENILNNHCTITQTHISAHYNENILNNHFTITRTQQFIYSISSLQDFSAQRVIIRLVRTEDEYID